MITIPFTQYHLPNGRANKELFYFQDGDLENSEQFNEKLQELLSNNVRFDAEILTTGIFSFTAELDDDLLSIQLADKGPTVIKAIEILVLDAHKELAKRAVYREGLDDVSVAPRQ